MRPSVPSRRLRQRGSALLIVFALAAVVAIMLYKEMPVVAFEARRNKEELLVERGHEYQRAVKLYVRKFQSFPPSIEALETTNRMRFLRRKYVDPFTDQADWRILHAGPGGIIIDSKIKQPLGGVGTSGNGSQQPGTGFGSLGSTSFGNNSGSGSFGNGSASSFGSGSGSSFGNSGSSFGNGFGTSNSQTADQSNTAGQTQAAGPVVPQRPPAISINGGAILSAGGIEAPPMTAPQEEPLQAAPIDPANPDAPQNIPQSVNQAMLTSSMPSILAGRRNMMDSASYPNPMATASNPPYPGYPGPPIANSDLQSGNIPPNAGGVQLVQQGAPGQVGGTLGTTAGGMGTIRGGGIAGVASISKGKTIKKINDQDELSLWEFVYDMRKEAAAQAGLGGSTSGNNSPINGQNNLQSSPNSSLSPFNQQQSSGFGSNPSVTAPQPQPQQ